MRKHRSDKKESEIREYMLSYHMSFDDLLLLIKSGIENNLKSKRKPICLNAFRKGVYLGSPGKDIYMALSWMNEEQIAISANELAKHYPSKPPQGHLGYAACIRYIYGCFDKQGCLLSSWHRNIMKKQNEDWSKPRHFMNLVNINFKSSNCWYGQVLYNEMEGHRLGDHILISNDYFLKDKMLFHYNMAHSIAVKIKSFKHTFTSMYWAASYLEYFDKKMAVEYHKKNLKFMEKYCPDSRPGYKEKATHSLKYIYAYLNKNEKDDYKKFLKHLKNKCLVKVKNNFK